MSIEEDSKSTSVPTRSIRCPTPSEMRERDAFYDLDEWRVVYQNDEIAFREDVLRMGNPHVFPFRASCTGRASTAPTGSFPLRRTKEQEMPASMRPSSSSSHVRWNKKLGSSVSATCLPPSSIWETPNRP